MYAKLFERRRGVQSAYDGGGGGCSPLTTGGGLPAVVSSVPSAVAIDEEEAPDARKNSEILLHPSVPSPLADKSLIFLDFRNEAPDCLSRFLALLY